MSTNTLSQHCAAALRATSDLVGAIAQDLPPEKQDALQRLLMGGGSVGLEIVTNGRGECTIRLIALEHEGARLVLATIAQPHGEAH